MRLGLSLGYQTAWTTPADHLAMAQEADRLGYSVVWAAEAYGSDSPSMLAWIAGQTGRIDVGAAVMQIPARTPAMTAMTAATIDTLSGGRFRLGLGVSGPQVSEGWHGVRFAKPLARTREYVDIVKLAIARKPVAYDGEHYTLPLPDGPGKALRLGFHPPRPAVPIYLAAVGPKNLELAGEISDGWLAIFFAPDAAEENLQHIRRGREKAGATLDGFDVCPSVPVMIGDDVAACADVIRWYAALYVGGMGSREQNFYNQLAVRMGYADEAKQVQDLYLSGKQRDAAAAVPQEFIERTSMIGPKERIAERMREYAAAGVDTLSVSLFAADRDSGIATLRSVAEAYEASGVAEVAVATVLLLRHGRTTANATGGLAGRLPVELDDTGRDQARRVGERLRALPLSAVVTSPLVRCRQTVELALPDVIPAVDEGLIECGYGDWEGRPLKELAKDQLWPVVQQHPSAVVFPNGEAMAAMSARAVATVRRWDAKVTAEHGADALWVACSHGDVIKAIVADAMGLHLDEFQRIVADPASVSVIRYTPTRPFLVRLNDTADLSTLVPPKKADGDAAEPAAQSDAAVGGGAGAGV